MSQAAPGWLWSGSSVEGAHHDGHVRAKAEAEQRNLQLASLRDCSFELS